MRSTEFVVRGVAGLPEVEAGADVAQLIADRVELTDGDILAITSKIVSKAEGQVRTGVDRDTVIDEETARVVSEWPTSRGRTRIVQTHHGFVLAAAGVDESNVAPGTIVPLPADPDGSARRLRQRLRQLTGAVVGVLITDTAGRPWRDGQIDFAIGAAGLVVRDDFRGRFDPYGNELGVTVTAVADELASASELVRGKLSGVPVAVVRGLGWLVTEDDGPGAAALVRPAEEDRFRLGTPDAMREAVRARRDVTTFTGDPVDEWTIRTAISAALTASATPTVTATSTATGTPPLAADPTTLWRFVVVDSPPARDTVRDLAGAVPDAPFLIVPCLITGDRGAERIPADPPSLLLSAGAAVQNMLISLGASGLGTHWTTDLRTRSAARTALDLPADWEPLGVVAVGRPAEPPPGRPDVDPDDVIITR